MVQPDAFRALLLDHVPSLLVFVDRQGVIVHASPSVAERLGAPRAALLGVAWRELVPENDRAACDALLSAALSGRIVRGHRHGLRAAQGESGPIEWSARPVSADGESLGVLYAGSEAPAGSDLYETAFASTLDQQVLLVVEGDGALRILAANPAARDKFRRLQFTDWPLEGKTVEELFAAIPSLPPLAFPHVHVALRERRRVEFRRTYQVGAQEFHFEGAVAPIFDARGECSHLLWFARDVTERVATEAALRGREERLLDAQSVAGLGTWELDLARNGAVWWSPEVHRILDTDPAGPASLEAFLDRLEPEDRAAMGRTYEQILAGEGAHQATYAQVVRVRLLGEEVRFVHARAQPRYDADGRLVRLLGTLEDVTPKVEAERNLQRVVGELWRAQSTLLLAERGARLGSMLFDYEDREIFASPGLRHLFELHPTEPVTVSTLLARVHPDDRDRVRMLPRARLDGTPTPIEYRVTLPDGSERVYRSTARVSIADERPMLVAVTQDITEQRRAADALARSLAEKESLLLEIHHRVKNNLQLVSSLLHFHARRIEDPRARAALEETSRRLLSMILVHEKLHPSVRTPNVPMDSYLRDLIVAAMGPAASTWTVDFALDPMVLPIDAALAVGMIAVELATNVLKHAYPEPGTGALSIALSGADGGWTLEVADRGRGLPPGLDLSRSTSLGWDLVRLWVAQLSARVDVSSSEGGTTVRVSC